VLITCKYSFVLVCFIFLLVVLLSVSANETYSFVNETADETISTEETNKTEKIISIDLSYEKGTPFDEDDDGTAYTDDIIDFSVNKTSFNWNVNEEKLCTSWKTTSLETDESTIACYGYGQCCGFIGLTPTRDSWNEVFYSNYGLYGATYNNTISAQVVYVDYNLSFENPYEDVAYSEWSSLKADFIEKTVTIFTKITELIVDQINAVKGAIVNIQAKLSYANDSPMPLETVKLYSNGSLVETGMTDLTGNIIFLLNTSELEFGSHLVNITFEGKERVNDQRTISIKPSYNFTLINIKDNETEINVNEVQIDDHSITRTANTETVCHPVEEITEICREECMDWDTSENGTVYCLGGYGEVCRNNAITKQTCDKTIYVGIKFVKEDGKWKDVKEARSLKNYFKVVKNEDPEWPAEVIDFNWTSITLDLDIGDDKHKNKDIELKVYDKEDKTKRPKDNNGNEKNKDKKINIKNKGEKQREIIDLSDTAESILTQEIKWGDNSTTFQIIEGNDTSLGEGYDYDYYTLWADVHNSPGAFVTKSSSELRIGDDGNVYTGDYTWILRGFAPINTSGLDDSASISSAKFCAKVTLVRDQDNDGYDYLVLVESKQSSFTNLIAGDFDQCGDAINNPSELSNRIDFGTMSAGSWTCWDLNAAGLANISKTGITPLAIREGHDVENSPIDPSLSNRLYLSSYESGDAPYLNVTQSSNQLSISSCTILNAPGAVYTLTQDIINSTASNCMDITSNNITLDCQGHTIDGNDVADFGVSILRNSSEITNVTVKNCKVTDWDSAAVQSEGSNNGISQNNFINLTISSNPFYGLRVWDSHSNIFENITIDGSKVSMFMIANYKSNCDNRLINVYGAENKLVLYYNETINIQDYNNNFSDIVLCGADNSTLSNIISSGNRTKGIIITATNNVSLSNITVENITSIRFYQSNNISLISSDISSSENGIVSTFSNDNDIMGNVFQDNDQGISFGVFSQDWAISNNLLNNTLNIEFGASTTNNWNTSNQSVVNIIGGSYLGGNYWAYPNGTGYSQVCDDINSDGFCDDPYDVENNVPCTSGVNCSNNTDYLPLTGFNDTTNIIDCANLTQASTEYTLQNNVTANGTCFVVNSNDITLDLNGYTIIGNGTGYGVYIDSSGSTIKNGNIYNFENGVYISSYSDNNLLLNNNIYENINEEIFDEGNISTKNYLVYNNSFGEIRWVNEMFLQNLTTEGDLTLPGNIGIGNNSAYFNSIEFFGLINSSANITLTKIGLRGFILPAVLRDDKVCTDCHALTNLTDSNVVFNVTGWSNYSIGEGWQEIIDGMFIVKFESGVVLMPENKTALPIQNLTIIPDSINQLIINFGVTYIEKVFPEQDNALKEIYKLNVSDTVNISDAVLAFENDTNVVYAAPVIRIKQTVWPNDPLFFPNQWALLNTTNISEAWNLTKGDSNIVIAIIDSGIDPSHQDLKNNIWNNTNETPNDGLDNDNNGFIDDIMGWDFVSYDGSGLYQVCTDDCTEPDNSLNDIDGHGTHVAGIAGAVTNNSFGISGVCYNCTILPLKAGYEIFDAIQFGYYAVLNTDDVARAIIYAADNGADIISMSFGGSESLLEEDAIDYAVNKGVILVAAAGNNGNNNSVYPAAYKNVLSVAATNKEGEKASYSTYGSWVDLAAPGDDIYSTWIGGGFQSLTGTSMATPIVSGTVALLLSVNPTLNVKDVAYILNQTAKIVGVPDYNLSRIDVLEAVNMTLNFVSITSPRPDQTFSLSCDDGLSFNVTLVQPAVVCKVEVDLGNGKKNHTMTSVDTYNFNWSIPYQNFSLGSYLTNIWCNFADGKNSTSMRNFIIDYTKINSCEMLQCMNQHMNESYTLENDINCSDTATGAGFGPIGDAYNNMFNGTLNGQNHIIHGLHINRPAENYIGLFGYTGPNFNVSNLGLEDVNITGNDIVGTIVGHQQGIVGEVYATGSVSGDDDVGGMVGRNHGTIKNTYANVSLTATGQGSGGIAGVGVNIINSSYAVGPVSGYGNVGGLVGFFVGNISNSFASNDVSGVSSIGGIIGYNGGTITNSYWNNHSDNPNDCYSGGNTECNVVQSDLEHFKGDVYSHREPMKSWQFFEIWEEREDNFPSLVGFGLGDYYDSTKVTKCGRLMLENVTYTLQNDIMISGNCFNITTRNITLDFVRFNITGDGSGNGITISGYNNSIIKEGVISGFKNGILIDSTSGDNLILNNNLFSNTDWEIQDLSSLSYKNQLIFNNTFGSIEWINQSFLQNLTTKGNLIFHKYQEDPNDVSAQSLYFYVNYTKPLGSVGSEWEVKHGTLQPYKISVPPQCWDYLADKIVLKISSISNDGAGHAISQPYCYDGFVWQQIGKTSISSFSYASGGYYGFQNAYDGDWNTYMGWRWNSPAGFVNQVSPQSTFVIYEEGIWWQFSNTNISILNNSIYLNPQFFVGNMNSSVNISLHGLTYDGSYPAILRKPLRNNTECTDCEKSGTFSGSTVNFQVDNFDGNYSVGKYVRDSSNVTLYSGWNMFAITLENKDNNTDRNISLSSSGDGRNLIGYSSDTELNTSSISFTPAGGNEKTWDEAVTDGDIKSELTFYDNNPSYKKYLHTPLQVNNLKNKTGYWVQANVPGNLTIKNVGGSFTNESYEWKNLMFTNCTEGMVVGVDCLELNISDANNTGWIDQRIQYWETNPPTGNVRWMIMPDNKEELKPWEGFVIDAKKDNIQLLRQN